MVNPRRETSASILRFRTNPGAELRIFCFPSAGSGASLLHSWFRDMPSKYEVCAIQPPGREDRHQELPFRRMAPLVAATADALEPVLDRPYALFGHSLGALVAFEVARELRRRGRPLPVRLFVSSRGAPQVPPRFEPIHHLAEREFIERLSLRYGPIPPVILADPDLMALFIPVLRADIEVLETYMYCAEDPLPVPISAMCGESDPVVDKESVQAWVEQTLAAATVRTFAGDHFYPRTAREEFLQAIESDFSE